MALESIMPCFIQQPQVGGVVGSLLAGYGELELEFCHCLMSVQNDFDGSIRMMFKQRGEKQRIERADKLTKAAFASVQLGSFHAMTIRNMHWCRELRNQYAHCSWYYTLPEGVCFVDLETVAKSKRKIREITKARKPIDEKLLDQQEAYFKYVQKSFWYLRYEYEKRMGRNPRLNWEKPRRLRRPQRHN